MRGGHDHSNNAEAAREPTTVERALAYLGAAVEAGAEPAAMEFAERLLAAAKL